MLPSADENQFCGRRHHEHSAAEVGTKIAAGQAKATGTTGREKTYTIGAVSKPRTEFVKRLEHS